MQNLREIENEGARFAWFYILGDIPVLDNWVAQPNSHAIKRGLIGLILIEQFELWSAGL